MVIMKSTHYDLLHQLRNTPDTNNLKIILHRVNSQNQNQGRIRTPKLLSSCLQVPLSQPCGCANPYSSSPLLLTLLSLNLTHRRAAQRWAGPLRACCSPLCPSGIPTEHCLPTAIFLLGKVAMGGQLTLKYKGIYESKQEKIRTCLTTHSCLAQ